MPLAFHSLSHGNVAFGFFNIESDMLLLEKYFFFSTVFCRCLSRYAHQADNPPPTVFLPGFVIDLPENIGDLMGAIHGIRYTGFIGDVYRRFPFPGDPRDFRQNPLGADSQETLKSLIVPYARGIDIPMAERADGYEIAIGDYRFSRSSFHQLIQYVWKGGYPRWKDNLQPDYVQAMKASLLQSRRHMFDGLD
ncbi:MAG: hypothetical protein DSY90_11595 [Deltaproteobacteria bacterium]|nr:MAG: hypothetical protein DSY90_11595 [Deltaproteobacteria bacterium]